MRKWLIAVAVMVISPWAVTMAWMRAAGLERTLAGMEGTVNGAGEEIEQEDAVRTGAGAGWNEGRTTSPGTDGRPGEKADPGAGQGEQIKNGQGKKTGAEAGQGGGDAEWAGPDGMQTPEEEGQAVEENRKAWGLVTGLWGKGKEDKEDEGLVGADAIGRKSIAAKEAEVTICRKILVERKGIRTYIDLEDYLPGVMACQMDGDYTMETMKCQAVIARTYIYRLLNGRTEIYEEELDMDYLGEGQEGFLTDREKLFEKLERCKKAAQATKGQVMKYEDRYILPLFHAVSAGRTRTGDGDFPYLQSVESVSDTKREDYMATPEWSCSSFAAAISRIPGATPVEEKQLPEQIQTVKKDDAGYVTEMRIGAGTYSGDEIQYALGLPSPCFNIEAGESGDVIRVRVRGKGHGYGLSQAGADSMAENGWGYEDILNHYYKNISLIFE